MENHPIPQDVTGFQFKLIGDMTIKQFVYLAGGVVSGWIFFILPLTPFIKLPFAFLFVLTGISLAFLPVEGRPMDIMIINFIKSIFSETQFVYKKSSANWFSNVPSRSTAQPLPKKLSGAPHIIPMTTSPNSSEDRLEKIKEKEGKGLKEKATALEKELEEAKTEEASLDKPSPTSLEVRQKVISLEQQLQEIMAQKEQLAQQILSLQEKLNFQKKNVFVPSTATPHPQTPNIRRIPKSMGKGVGLPIAPESPNLITGIIKNPRGNPLPNILVEIKDSEGNPVRAFKTSLLGQFASATSLANGTYTIVFEDPKSENKFDTIEFIAKGEIILPLEIISIDTREELRRSLFSQT